MSVSSFVESVEYIEFNFNATDASVSTDLSKGQNYENCVPFFTSHSQGYYYDSKFMDVYFSGTTISGVLNCRRWNQRSNTATVKCYIVEFNSTEVRVQQGTFDVTSSTTDTVTLPTTISGGVGKAAMLHAWRSSSDLTYISPHAVRGRIVDTTSIDFYRNNTNGSCDGHWFLFEDLGENFKVTHNQSSFGADVEDYIYADNTVVDHLRMFYFISYASDSVSYLSRESFRAYLLGENVIRMDKYDGNYNIYYYFQVFEFLDTTKVYTPYETDTPHAINANETSYLRDLSSNQDNRVPFRWNHETSIPVYGVLQGTGKISTSTEAYKNGLFTSIELTTSSGVLFEQDSIPVLNSLSSYAIVDWAGIDIDLGTNDDPIPEGYGVGKSFVKSVENFRFTLEDYFGAKALSKGQDWRNCVIFATFKSGGATYQYPSFYTVCVWFVDPGIVCFKHWYTTAYHMYIDVSVVEFWPDQVKVQHKLQATRATTTNVTIDEVSNIEKCFLLSKVLSTDTYTYMYYTATRVSFLDESTVELYREGINGNYPHMVFFSVVEDLGNHFVTKHSLRNCVSSNGWLDETYNWPIYSTFHVFSFATNCPSPYPSRGHVRSYYNREFYPVYMDKSDGNYYLYCYVTLVKFVDNMNHIQMLSPALTGGNDTSLLYYSTDAVGHENALTAMLPAQSGTTRCDTTSADYLSQAFVTMRITDYETREIEVSKYGTAANTHVYPLLIDWIGYDYYTDNNIVPMTRTRSVINSIQREELSGTGTLWNIYLTLGQNVAQCVPFITRTEYSSSPDMSDLYFAIYRYESPDRFIMRYGGAANSSRDILLNIFEFSEDIKVQYGDGYFAGTSKNFTINEVNTERAFIVFYTHTLTSSVYNSPIKVCSYFSNSTTVTFTRFNSTDYIFISWYIIECTEEDDFWKVQHLYRNSVGAGTDIYSTMDYFADMDRSIVLASWNTNANDDDPARNLFRVYHRQDDLIQFNKSDGNYGMTELNTQVIEISDKLCNLGFKVTSDYITMSAGSYTTIASLKKRAGEEYDLNRSIALLASMQGETRVDTTNPSYYGEGIYRLDFDDGNTVRITRNSSSTGTNSYVFFYAYQLPDFYKYYMEGYVTEFGEPASREVKAFRSSTGIVVDSTISVSGTGYFFLETPYYEEHDVICYDNDEGNSFNHLIYGKVLPVTISGSFAFNQGLTASGIPYAGIPLGRL